MCPKESPIVTGTLAALEMLVPCDSHWKYQPQLTGANWDLKGRLCVLPKVGPET